MKSLLGLLVASMLHASEVQIDLNKYVDMSYGISYEEPLSGRWSYQLSYENEKRDNLINYKTTKSCGSKKIEPQPAKKTTQIVVESKSKKVTKFVDRYEAKILYTLTGYKSLFLDLFTGLGYTDDVYKHNVYVPSGVRFGSYVSPRVNMYYSYKVITDCDLNKHEDTFTMSIGVKF